MTDPDLVKNDDKRLFCVSTCAVPAPVSPPSEIQDEFQRVVLDKAHMIWNPKTHRFTEC